MAAKGWINVQCQLHIKSMLYKKQQLETISKPRENELKNMEWGNFEIKQF